MTFTYPAFTPKKEGSGYMWYFLIWNAVKQMDRIWRMPLIMLRKRHITGFARKWKKRSANFPSQTHEGDLELEEGQFVRKILVRIKLLPDND